MKARLIFKTPEAFLVSVDVNICLTLEGVNGIYEDKLASIFDCKLIGIQWSPDQ